MGSNEIRICPVIIDRNRRFSGRCNARALVDVRPADSIARSGVGSRSEHGAGRVTQTVARRVANHGVLLAQRHLLSRNQLCHAPLAE
jgi:hypothetical protein